MLPEVGFLQDEAIDLVLHLCVLFVSRVLGEEIELAEVLDLAQV
jgi:hypothetical protein